MRLYAAHLQGGVRFPTGGDSPRAQARSGGIPGPTVMNSFDALFGKALASCYIKQALLIAASDSTVRMKEDKIASAPRGF